MTTALVTGGAGFMGCHVARCLLAAGREVVVLDDLSGGYRDNVPAGAHFIQGSVTDAGLLAHLFTEHHFTDVYHLAAYAAEGLSHFIRAFNYANNVVGSMHVINECVKHQVRALVFTSSIAVYGASQVPISETDLRREHLATSGTSRRSSLGRQTCGPRLGTCST